MQFKALLLLAPFVVLTAAAPNAFPDAAPAAVAAPVPVDMTPRDTTVQMTEILNFATNAASCNLFKCIDLVGAGVCIVDKIKDKDVSGLVKCVKGGAKAVSLSIDHFFIGINGILQN